MRFVAAALCLALAAGSSKSAHAEEVRPRFDGLDPGEDAFETYRLNALEIVHEELSGVFPTIFVGRNKWWRPVRGKFRYATSYDEFFLKTGRDDLGERHRHRRAVATTLFWGGMLVSLAGLGIGLSGLAAHHGTRAEAGLGMVAGGFLITAIGSSIQPPLVSEEDAVAMANEYNRRLRIRLGLAPVSSTTRRDSLTFALSLSSQW